jgi:broad specificity phosphatase PhoE
MKWPNTLTVVRHGQSAYNELKGLKEADPLYAEFKRAYSRRGKDPRAAKELAQQLISAGKFILGCGDHDTKLTDAGGQQAEVTGSRLSELISLPDVIFVSPYLRTHHTLGRLAVGWPELADVKTVEEERVREQEHGLALLYNDWRIFNTMHPEQEKLRNLQGPYWYRYPQGENVPDVRERHRSMLGTFTRDYAEQNVLIVGHHLSILSLRANLERLDADGFIDLDLNHKPVNCGATVYRGGPNLGQDGHLELDIYNQQLY